LKPELHEMLIFQANAVFYRVGTNDQNMDVNNR
jgi:hypothetical protein